MLSAESNETGAPYDTFLAIHKVLLALKKCNLSAALKFVSQCSAILGEHESLRNYKEFRIIFPKILDAF